MDTSISKILQKLFHRVLNPFPNNPGVLQFKSFENTVGKGEIAQNEQFLLFSPCFSTHLESFPPFSSSSKLLSASLEESKMYRLGNSLKPRFCGKCLSLNHTNKFCFYAFDKDDEMYFIHVVGL